MHATVYHVFEEIVARANIRGPVLEVGAVPGPDSLLSLPSLAAAGPKIGMNANHGGDCGAYEIIRADANVMDHFPSDHFAAVLCNATLEHDRRFWLTIAEIRRVAAPGGFVALGVPGYADMGLDTALPRGSLLSGILRLFALGRHRDFIRASTVTLGVHNHPGDYYRFSEQAVREVFMAGYRDVSLRTVLSPPRIIASGRKP